MQLYRELAEVPPAPGGRALAVGTFDGVHIGHRRVIEGALAWGRDRDVSVAVVTFEPHPLRVLRPDDPPRLLTPLALKADRIASLGVDELVAVPFTSQLSRLEPERFSEEVLVGVLRARYVSVGANFRFGRGATGDADLLQRSHEFETAVVPLVQLDSDAVSSSRIRRLLESGEVALAAELLGAPFELEGEVARGSARGRELGMPTANIRPEEGVMVPGAGVYAGTALGHAAAINVGVRPTFERDGPTLVEAYLLDFDGDLYGRRMRVAFLQRLRNELRFESGEELVQQMRHDVARVRQIVC